MAAVLKPITIEQGTTFRLPFTWGERGPDDADGNPTMGQPYDLTGCTARMQVRKKAGGELLAEATTENGKIALGGAAGTVLVVLTDEDTDAITARKGVYDLEIEWPSGDVDRLLKGPVTFDPSVTRAVP